MARLKATIPATDDRRAGEIERLLLYLGLYTIGRGCPDPMFFNGALPTYKSQWDQVFNSVGPNTNRAFDEAAARCRTLSGSALFFGCNDDDDDGFTLFGGRPLAADVKLKLFRVGALRERRTDRGRVDRLCPFFEIRRVAITPDGVARDGGTAYMTQPVGSHTWYAYDPGPYIKAGRHLSDVGFGLAVALSTAARKEWFVNLSFAADAPSLRLVTDPVGVREFFKFRDIPEGASRRAALRHWVSEHWRGDRQDAQTETYVREHLRGATRFSWHGLEAEIHAPEADLVRQDVAIARRKRMSLAEARRRRR